MSTRDELEAINKNISDAIMILKLIDFDCYSNNEDNCNTI
ncbi:6669_t:CDS:2 [Dentiscutata erythropus]|uniref:6669_t:CDS:1 n=1 Tax=Dentiscutata erythropus TaxID=1348616 RepID=A0A9N9DKV8_9GLOM|nr:6669_t:CDS:2 [Dentiscutata erythropus]